MGTQVQNEMQEPDHDLEEQDDNRRNIPNLSQTQRKEEDHNG